VEGGELSGRGKRKTRLRRKNVKSQKPIRSGQKMAEKIAGEHREIKTKRNTTGKGEAEERAPGSLPKDRRNLV